MWYISIPKLGMTLAQYWWPIIVLLVLIFVELIFWILIALLPCSICTHQAETASPAQLAPSSTTLLTPTLASTMQTPLATATSVAPFALTLNKDSCLPCQRKSWTLSPPTKSTATTATSLTTRPTTANQTCPSLLDTFCGEKVGCVDLQTDSKHCGQCGNTCAPGTRCRDGRCVRIFA